MKNFAKTLVKMDSSEFLKIFTRKGDPYIFKVMALTMPIPKSCGFAQFKFIRKSSGFIKTSPKFYLMDESNQIFILNAKKLICTRTIVKFVNEYIISTQKDVFDKDSYCYLGNLKGSKQKILRSSKDPDTQAKKHYCAIAYKQKSDQRCLLKEFELAIPSINDKGIPDKYESPENDNKLINQLKNATEDKALTFKSAPPFWNNNSNSYTLNLSERVKKSSIKSFQIVKKSEQKDRYLPEDVYIEFGKISQNEFTLSLRWPFSIITAFSLAISAFE